MAAFAGISLNGDKNEDIVDALIAQNRSLEYLFGGKLGSDNIMEVGGWYIGPTELRSRDFDVGMSTDDSTLNPVRFWAGGVAKETAPWRVTENGKMHATGATIRSGSLYPYLEFDSDLHLMTAYGASPSNKLSITPIGDDGLPALQFYHSTYHFGLDPVGHIFHTGNTNGLVLQSRTNMWLIANSLTAWANITVPSWSSVYSSAEARTLKQELDDLRTIATSAQSTAGSAWSMAYNAQQDVMLLEDHVHFVTTDTGSYVTGGPI